MDNVYKMPRVELSSEELSLLKTCVALVSSGVIQDRVVVGNISNIIKKKSRTLDELYLKLDNPRQKKIAM